MQAKDIEKKAEELAEPFLAENSYELVDVEYVKEGPQQYLRVYADKEGGFSIDDCEKLSRYLEKKLEEDDFIENAYILEVSSPGIDRILKKDKEFEKYSGKDIYIKLFKPDENGEKEFVGKLIGLKDNKIAAEIDGSERLFERKLTAVCRLWVEF